MKKSNNPVSSVLPAVRIPKKELNVRIGNLDWQAATDFFPFLTSSQAPDWISLDQDPNAVSIKKNPLRQIYRWRKDQQDLFVKIYRTGTIPRFLRSLFLGSPSQTEFRNLQIANSLGVPAPLPVAWSRGGFGKNTYAILLTRSLGDTVSLDSLIWKEPSLEAEPLKQALVLSAQLVAKLHRAGISHPDFHPGNIILTPGDAQKEFYSSAYVTDLQKIRLCQRPSQTEADPRQFWRMKNLAMLVAGLRKRISDEHLSLFIETYFRTIQPKAKPSPELLHNFKHDIDLLANRHRMVILNRKDRRSMRNSRYCKTIRLGRGWTAQVYCQSKRPVPFSNLSRCQFTPEVWKNALKDPENLLQNAEIIKKGTWNTVASGQLRMGNQIIDVVLKHSQVPRTWKGFFKGFYRSRAMRNWYRANLLIHRDIPTAWPLAAMERTKWILSHDQSILISQKIRESQTLLRLVKSKKLPPLGKRRDALSNQIGNLLGKLYLYRIRHRDCKATNIMVQPTDENTRDLVYLIDLDGLQKHLPYITIHPHQAIIRLGISLGDQNGIFTRDSVRVFRAYFRTIMQSESLWGKHNRMYKKELWKLLESRINQGLQQKKLRMEPS